MKRWIAIITIMSASLSTIGCSMCCGPFDFDYPNYGGKHQRVDPRYGRVGSIFSDPNAGFAGPSADSNLKPPPEPFKAQKLEEIDPLDDPMDFDPDAAPLPDLDVEDDSTASRRWKNRPLRAGQNWR